MYLRYACLFWILSYIIKITWKKTVRVQEHANTYLLSFWGSHFLEGDFLDLIIIQVYTGTFKYI